MIECRQTQPHINKTQPSDLSTVEIPTRHCRIQINSLIARLALEQRNVFLKEGVIFFFFGRIAVSFKFR